LLVADFGVSAKNVDEKQRRDSFIGTPYWYRCYYVVLFSSKTGFIGQTQTVKVNTHTTKITGFYSEPPKAYGRECKAFTYMSDVQ